jgi:methionyl-tRNA formyltransferase
VAAATPPARALRIVFVAPDEPSVLPIFFARVIPRLRGEIAAVAVVSPIYKRSSWLRQARQFIGAFGLREFLVEAAWFGWYKLADRVPGVMGSSRHHSVAGAARARGIDVVTPSDVNGPEFLTALRRIAPDLVVSVSCPQIFGRELLALPRLGCVNVHSALLPAYRGMLPTFWALARGERETGVTIHYMSPGIDGGDIIAQRAIPIGPDATLRSLMRQCKLAAADLVLETVARFRQGPVPAVPNPADEGSYFSFPTREDVRRFKALGRRLR